MAKVSASVSYSAVFSITQLSLLFVGEICFYVFALLN